MSVERKDIILIGVNVGYDLSEYDEFYDDLDDHSTYREGEITYVLDGMCGNYLYIGEVLKYSSDMYEGFEFSLDSINEENFKESANRVKEYVKSKFNLNVTPSLHVVAHIY